MKKAFRLALAAKGRTFPNPAVGAVVVSNGQVVGTGATQQCGGPHAEKVALQKAGDLAKGATLYVTLEPCCHFGRTPPCTEAIIASGVKKVVAAVHDPNPLVSGNGFLKLQEAGIEISSGILEQECLRLNEDFCWSITQKKAWITVKLALTLDGRIADGSNFSKWITGEQSRNYVHELRRKHAAVGIGRATLDIDDPKLTVRHKKGYNPARIVFSSNRQIPEASYFYQHSKDTRSIIVIPGQTRKIVRNVESGLEEWYTGALSYSDNLKIFPAMAYEEGISSVFIEGGQKIASQFLELGLVNRLYLFYGNRLVGKGKEGILFSEGLPMKRCISLDQMESATFGEDFMVTGIPRYGTECS